MDNKKKEVVYNTSFCSKTSTQTDQPLARTHLFDRLLFYNRTPLLCVGVLRTLELVFFNV